MDPDAVAAFVERAGEAISDAPQMGTRNTQLRVVEPFLSTLGWDVRTTTVEAAYSAPDGTLVDYALCPGDRPGALVAVTACADALTTTGRDELVDAMRAAEVDRGMYTNGRRYLLLALDAEAGEGADARTEPSAEGPPAGDYGDGTADGHPAPPGIEEVELALADLPQHVQALSALHRETVAALDVDARREAAAALVDDAGATAASVSDAVVDATGDALPAATVRETVDPLARRFLEAVVDELAPSEDPAVLETSDPTMDAGDETVEPGDETVDGDDASGSSAPTLPGATSDGDDPTGLSRPNSVTEATVPGGAGGRVDKPPAEGSGAVTTLAERASAREGAAGETEFVMRFFEDGRSVGAVGNPDPASAVAQGVQYLLEERGLGPRLRFPYAPDRDDVAFLHREPVHPDGRAMADAIDLGGLFVSLDEDLGVLQERVESLAERSGLRVMFAGDWPAPDA